VKEKQKGRTAEGGARKVEGKRGRKGKRVEDEEEEEGDEEWEGEGKEDTGIEDDLESDDHDDLLFLPKRGMHRRSKPAAPGPVTAPAGPVTAPKGVWTLGSFWNRPRSKAATSEAKAEPSTLEDSTLDGVLLSAVPLGVPGGRGSEASAPVHTAGRREEHSQGRERDTHRETGSRLSAYSGPCSNASGGGGPASAAS